MESQLNRERGRYRVVVVGSREVGGMMLIGGATLTMCRKRFQIRIASIIPVTYNAEVGGVTERAEPLSWNLQQPDEFVKVVDGQMGSLAAEWDVLSSSFIEIVHLPEQVDTVIAKLQRCGKCQPLKKKQHEITRPSIKTLINEARARDGRLRDAMLYYVWIVFPRCMYDRLTGQQRKGHYNPKKNSIWVPGLEVKLLERDENEEREDRVGHEFKEWLVDAARTLDKGSFEKHEVDERRLSSRDVMNRLNSDTIARLRSKFDYKPDWAAQRACDTVDS